MGFSGRFPQDHPHDEPPLPDRQGLDLARTARLWRERPEGLGYLVRRPATGSADT